MARSCPSSFPARRPDVPAFRQRDIQAAVRGATKAGFAVGRVELTPDGRILLLPVSGQPSLTGDELDDELAAWRAQSGQGRP